MVAGHRRLISGMHTDGTRILKVKNGEKTGTGRLRFRTTTQLGRPNAPDEVPAVPVVGVIAVELAIARTVAQAITSRDTAGSGRPPDPVHGTVEGAIAVVAAGDYTKSGKASS